MFLHTGNRLEKLAAQLALQLRNVHSEVLRPQVVVVPSLAMRRWLSFQIARSNAVCANIAFPFLSDFISALPGEILAGSGLSRRFESGQMLWRIHEILPTLLQRKEFGPVRAYLADADPLKLYQLSARIAGLFDQYVVYRPEMLDAWERSTAGPIGDEAWQAILWEEVTRTAVPEGSHDRSASATREALPSLPLRIFVFGVTEMPPVYLRLLFKVAGEREVQLFQLRPSRKYYGNDPTPKQRLRWKIDDPEFGTANPLLVSLGQASASFTELLIETEERLGHSMADGTELFESPSATNLLSTIQSDIVSALNRGVAIAGDPETKKKSSPRLDDRSIAIHSCHSAMREVEVLYDQLLALFESDPRLRPRDILVMASEIERYSPLVEAVFGYPEKAEWKIPYSISDREARSQSVVLDTFLTLLELATSRCTAEEIYSVVSADLVAARFALSAPDLELIHTWIRDSGIRWGIDAKHRQQIGLPPVEANTWRFGLDRLLLGYAIRGANRNLFEGILPYDEIEGDRGELLGRFVSAVEEVVGFIRQLQLTRPLSDWATVLRQGADALLETDDPDHVRDLRFLRKTISGLESIAGDPQVGISVLRQHLEQLLGAMKQRGGFLTGGVTFCALKPGRSIPARVVCLLGMNDEVFPRRPQPPQFDLMAKRHLGDPSPREDDRQAFLETVCAAGERLYISYVGRSIVHNQEILPSVVVSELLDYLDQAFAWPRPTSARSFVALDHPLQAFSPRYFSSEKSDPRLFSYSEANAAAAASTRMAPLTPSRSFLTKPLTASDTAQRQIELQQLIGFLTAPARFFLKERFGVDLREFEAALRDDEPLQLGPLDQYHIRQELVGEWLETGKTDLNVFAARGLSAPGAVGKLQLRSLDRETERFHTSVMRYVGNGQKEEPVLINQRLGDLSLTGSIDSLYAGRIVHYRCAKLNLKDRLGAWVDHLVSCATTPERASATILVGTDKVIRWEGFAGAEERLRELCQLYVEASQRPIPFFPRSGFAYVLAESSGKNGISAARQAWDPYRMSGEKDDGAIQLLFPAADPCDAESIEWARKVFGPLIEHGREEELP